MTEGKKAAVYISLYVDKGERLPKLRKQFAELSEHADNAAGVYCDILYGPGQEALATRYMEAAHQLAERWFPGVPAHLGATFAATTEDDPRHEDKQ